MVPRRAASVLGVMMMAAGCVVDVPIEKVTAAVTVEGNAILHAAGTRLFGEIVRPYRVTKTIDRRDLSTVHLTSFELEVTPDSEAPGDPDDLAFVESAVLVVESLDPAAGLPVLEIAWYDLPGDAAPAPRVLTFDVDSDVELRPYFRTGFRLSSTSTHLVPPDDVSVRGRVRFHGEHVVF